VERTLLSAAVAVEVGFEVVAEVGFEVAVEVVSKLLFAVL
jgi:hypothetical protein